MTPALLFAALVATQPPAMPLGSNEATWSLDGTDLKVFTHCTPGYRDGPVLMVFHGTLRNAAEYRDSGIPLAYSANAAVVAPLFDRDRFPNDKYHRGGLLANDRAVPEAERTWALVPKLMTEARRRVGKANAPVVLFGHSAGGQFLVRMAAFQPVAVKRIVAANPGSVLTPSREVKWPYGFGGLPPELQTDDVLRRYVGAPLTLYLGTSDTLQDPDLDTSAEAMAQGPNRFERGTRVYEEAERLAKAKGWPFGWKVESARGVGHDGKAMLAHPTAREILTGEGRVR